MNEGDDKSFTVSPDPRHEVDQVRVDGRRMRLTPENTFHFINVGKDYALSVSFKKMLIITDLGE